MSIFRYRLYNIDLLIKRTLVYGVTSASIAVAFFLGLVALQAALRPFTSGSELAVAASTLGSFALFQPIRRRVRDAVDRRFDRRHYDAERTVDAFSTQLRDEVDLEAIRSDLLRAVSETLQPSHATFGYEGDYHLGMEGSGWSSIPAVAITPRGLGSIARFCCSWSSRSFPERPG